ncbi:MAG: tRNA (adenosine(37)-N6)-threonylcarbamoyltransferase complex dimerization subunit type 1 TsaB [bacterium]
MKILSIDTSANTTYICLSENENILESVIMESLKNNYSTAKLVPSILKVLKNNNLTAQDLNAIAVNIGPGSFTGIRVGITVARTMGQALNIPVIGLPSLKILSTLNKTDKKALILLDARKGKTYRGVYTQENHTELCPEAIEYEQGINLAKENDYFVITDKTMKSMFSELNTEAVDISEIKHDFGIELSKLALIHLKSKPHEELAWFKLKPLYIQPPPISMPKKAV